MLLYSKLYINKINMKIIVVWASANSEKFWNKILLDLIKKWHTVYPVNPNMDTIEWIKAYKTLKDAPTDFDIVNFVVPSNIVLMVLEKNIELLMNKKIWIQPWAENQEIKNFLKNNSFTDYITDSCIMIEDITK